MKIQIPDLSEWKIPPRFTTPACASTRLETQKFVEQGLNLCLDMCMAVRQQSHTAAMLTASIDFLLTQQQQHGTDPGEWHYQIGSGAVTHLMPVHIIRELLLHKKLCLDQVFDLPLVLGEVEPSQHHWHIFSHHTGASPIARNGHTVPTHSWTLADHFSMLSS